MTIKIRPLNQLHRNTTLKILKTHPEFYGKFDAKKDINHLFASQMWEVIDEKRKFVGMFGFNRFDFYNFNGLCEDIVFANCYVCKKYRKMGVFNEMIKFAKEQLYKERKECEEYACVYMSINCEKGNKLAKEIYDKKFDFIRYDEKDKIYWWEIR